MTMVMEGSKTMRWMDDVCRLEKREPSDRIERGMPGSHRVSTHRMQLDVFGASGGQEGGEIRLH